MGESLSADALISLDEPLHLHILTSLASNLAKSPPTSKVTAGPPEGAGTSNSSESDIHIISKGLPSNLSSAQNGFIAIGGDEEDEGWVSAVNLATSGPLTYCSSDRL